MRSEKELRKDVTRLEELIKETVEDMLDSINDGDYALGHYVQNFNEFYNELTTLNFILNDKGYK